MSGLSEEECHFFDAHDEEIASIPDAKFETLDSHYSADNSIPNSPHFEVWRKSLMSVEERRSRFLNWMRVGMDQHSNGCSDEVPNVEGDVDRIRESSGAVSRRSNFEDEFCSTRSIMSCWSNDNTKFDSDENFICREGTCGGGMVCNDEVSLEHSVTAEESEGTSVSSLSIQQLIQKEIDEPSNLVSTSKIAKKRWLNRLRSIACVLDIQREAEKMMRDNALLHYKLQRVKVRQFGKRIKELSALYKGQDIQAHEGSIRTMKFSPDGQYLASAGEDRIVRLWQVLENERSNELDIPEIDPSCVYFNVNHLSELKPLFIGKEKTAGSKSLRKTSDSACIILPPKVFRILEKPLHLFRGHNGEILDLCWSNDHSLLSASEDKTVRLWRVGSNHCLRIFSHSNYVTCVQFNPIDNNYFVSGSIDGKVRIWAISCCQVVDWTDIKEIVTAVCYHPDGKGGIIGSMEGNCRFYNMSDSHLQLDNEICLHSKKKSSSKRITGFQFLPRDSTKVMVTSADSQVRVLQGHNVISKYKCLRNASSQMAASFTSDGKHIISTCEDSNVYLWDCIDQQENVSNQAKEIRSWENFSINASIAIPWSGLRHGNLKNEHEFCISNDYSPENVPFSFPADFSLSQEYFLESYPKGSATWPEEKLPTSRLLSASSGMNRSHIKFLETSCQNTAISHAWGLVIVTAGWDGRIRSFHNYGLPVSLRDFSDLAMVQIISILPQ